MNRIGRIHVIEDGIDITENDNLVDFEIEDSCYVNGKFIGTTVSKKITVNILNPDNNINIENKEIVVKAGIVIDGTEELVPFGNFIIEKPTNEETKQKTKFIGYDYMIKFNKKYEDTSTYPITLKKYITNLCSQVGVEFGNTELTNGEYEIQGNPFTNNEDCKTVLSNVAQLCGGFAHIGRDNKLYITNIGGEIQETMDGNNYFSLEKNEQYGEVNSLVIRLSQVEGENTPREDAESIATNGLTEITIADNYFLNDEEEREKVIDAIFDKLKGLKYTPITSSYYGFPYLDIGDAITILDSKNVEYSTYIFNHKFKYNGGFSGNIETVAMTKTQTAYKNNIDIKSKFQNVELKVDKINGTIETKIEDQNKKISQVTQTVDKINQEVGTITGENSIKNGEFTDGLQNWVTSALGGTVKVKTINNKNYANLMTMNGRTSMSQVMSGLFADMEYTLEFDIYDNNPYDITVADNAIFTIAVLQNITEEEIEIVYTEEMQVSETEERKKIKFTLSRNSQDVWVEFGLTANGYLYDTASAMIGNVVLSGGDITEKLAKLNMTADKINIEVGKKVNNEDFTGANIMLEINGDTSSTTIKADKVSLERKRNKSNK